VCESPELRPALFCDPTDPLQGGTCNRPTEAKFELFHVLSSMGYSSALMAIIVVTHAIHQECCELLTCNRQALQGVMQGDRTAAGQVAMLLRSCINEVRTNSHLEASLQLMTQLDALLKEPHQRSPGHHSDPSATMSIAPLARLPPAVCSERRAAAPAPSGHGMDSRLRGSASRAIPGAAGDRGDTPGHDGIGTAAAIKVSSFRLQGASDGEAGIEESSITCVGRALRLSALHPAVDSEEVTAALWPFAVTCVEAPQPGQCLVELEAIGAAIRAFQVLPLWLERLGFGCVRVAFMSSSNADAGTSTACVFSVGFRCPWWFGRALARVCVLSACHLRFALM
jgi:hypothetical protein